ncbi:DUF3558 family protein [Amycolatopsis alba]|uniref:DUF3558 domain-containing protein n=1 Tax=Amycolatopsis alba DSM 44262 TaxID=1125972 RepID=A0A229RHY4_AMYAL|nr:DUF3558 family protein [Amycolatopsis alba]OXM46195.1 DUF3558 domain-containing protein [Amycolatopsis alba DSM 44262]
MNRRRKPIAVLFAVVLLLGGCSETISGTASPVPGQGPVLTKAAPCSLLTPEHADALALKLPGVETKGDRSRQLPPMCLLSERDDSPHGVSLSITQSVDVTLNEFYAGAQPGEKFGIGGFTWTRYPSPLGPTACSLSTELGPSSFVELGSETQPGAAETTACDLALAAAPAIASKLPGGQPAPKIVAPPGQKKPEPSGPLLRVDPCALLKPDEAAKLAIAAGTPVDQKYLANPEDKGCEWKDSDGDKGQRPLNVTFFPSTAVADVAGLEGTPEETDLAGRKWTVRSNTALKYCTAALPITGTSTVKVSSGHGDDEAKACDLLRAALPTVSAALPADS